MRPSYDAVIVGSGPNGLTAAIVLALAGQSVLVIEANTEIGGGCRSGEVTLPGYVHDLCAAVHPMAVLSPIFKTLRLEDFGVQWVIAPHAAAHPFDDGTAAVLSHSLESTAATLGDDADAWLRLMKPFCARAGELFEDVLRPLRVPHHPLLMARFGLHAVRSCASFVRSAFRRAAAKGLFAGCAAHSFLPLDAPGSAAFGLILALTGHAFSWPYVRGGSQQIVNALMARLRDSGGEFRNDTEVRSMRDVPQSKVVLFDLNPHQLDRIAADALPTGYRKRLRRYRLGAAAFKIDYALDAPIPWRAAQCHRASTVHLGASFEEIATSEHAANHGQVAAKPFVLVAQPTRFDPGRAPDGKHTAWVYCHVPNGSTVDYTAAIEAQLERFAPGFSDRVVARHTRPPAAIEADNAAMPGGAIAGGANDLMQVLFRPLVRINPYTTPNERIFLCSSATPPGGGVHGMCGYWAARAALARLGVTTAI